MESDSLKLLAGLRTTPPTAAMFELRVRTQIVVHNDFKHFYKATGRLALWEDNSKRLREQLEAVQEFIKEHGRHAKYEQRIVRSVGSKTECNGQLPNCPG